MASFKSRFVADNSRTSTGSVSLPPTRSISRSCTARKIFACSARLISTISSRNRAPPVACAKRPILRVMAPVNAPFSWPNSSLSSRFSGIAAQFTATTGPLDLGPLRSMARATPSFPVPDSPLISAVAALPATEPEHPGRGGRRPRPTLAGSAPARPCPRSLPLGSATAAEAPRSAPLAQTAPATPPASWSASRVAGAAHVARDQHECVIAALPVAGEDALRQVLRRCIPREVVGERRRDAVGGEDEGVARGDGEDVGAQRWQLRANDPPAREEGGARRAAPRAGRPPRT